MTAIIITLILAIPVSILWVNTLDKAIDNDEWEQQREADRQEEDREQEEYLRKYIEKQKTKKKRKGR